MYGRFRRESEGSCRSPQRSIGWHMHPTVITVVSYSFTKERQEEIDQLLYKTRIEMHGTSQRSPKQVNVLTPSSQLKSGSENAPNSGTSFPSQTKGKKRERRDHSTDPVKRECFSRTDDIGSCQHRAENNLKSDIGKITEKGGVVDFEGVEKLVQLMQPDRLEKKFYLISRSLLAGVVAATEKVECLNLFMQLKGLSVFDEWLQEIHKGNVVGGNNAKDGDKSVEDFLLVLLRALDKLPVNLPALQTCNIGRSVNHLRTHKNVDIQRKARSLVDIWKKRVQAEMSSIDAETSSSQGGPAWSSKSRLPEASHAGSRTPSGFDVAVKSTITQHSASKTTSLKSSHGENNTKSASLSPGPFKPSSPLTSVKESQTGTSVCGSGTPDIPVVREDWSISSNQSHSFSDSISIKEEAKILTATPSAASKISSNSSRNRKGGGFPMVSVAKKESNASRTLSAIRSSTSDKIFPSGTAGERVVEGPVFEVGNSKLIVKILNRQRSPTQGVSGVSPDDPSVVTSQTSPPVLSDKLDQFDNNSSEKSNTLQCDDSSDMNVDSTQVNDRKDILTGSGNGAGPVAVYIEDKSMSPEDAGQLMEGPTKNQLKHGKLHATSFSPMNALIESCVKYSEAHSSLSPEDDAGMNLLASVATGEISRSELISPTESTERNTSAKEEVCFSDDAKSECSPEDEIRETENQHLCNVEDGGYKKHALLNGSQPDHGLHVPKQASFSSDLSRRSSHTSAEMSAGVRSKVYDSASADTKSNADPKWEVSKKLTQKTDTNLKTGASDINKEVLEDKAPTSNSRFDNIFDCKTVGINVTGTEDKSGDYTLDTTKGAVTVEVKSPNQSYNVDNKTDANDGLMAVANSMKKITTIVVKSEVKDIASNVKLQQTSPHQIFSESGDVVRVGERDDGDIKSHVSEVESDNFNKTMDRNTALEGRSFAGSRCSVDGLKDGNVEKKEIGELISVSKTRFPASVVHDVNKNDDVEGARIKLDEVESTCNIPEPSSAAIGPDLDEKIRFDLNEWFTVDDGKCGEPVSLVASVSADVQIYNCPQSSVSPNLSLHPASITVAAAAKGAFVPPEDLLRSKGELGWKGSAATSAFRPAEPRKVTKLPMASSNLSCDASTSKNGRVMLDIDLNVDLNAPDEKIIDGMSSREYDLVMLNRSSGSMPHLGFGGLDLDLNRVDESNENGQCSTSRSHDTEGSAVHAKSFGGLSSADFQRGFDLNDRPGFDEGTADHSTIIQHVKVAMPSQLPLTGPGKNNPGLGSLSSWFPPANTYSPVAIPSVIPDRADQSFPVIPPGAAQRTFGPAGISSFIPDVYRGSVLSSSPAVSFPSSPCQFSVFPYGPFFPLPSASFPVGGTSHADSLSGTRVLVPPVNSQLLGVGPVGAISSPSQRLFMVGLPDNSSNSGLENSRKWVGQGLDLNAGPGAVEADVRDASLLHSSSQHSVANLQLQAEEKARLYPVSGNILKRTEPDGGWDTESFRYKKQSSWQ